MTPEEAGQRLLEGGLWVDCSGGCDGGWFYDEGYTAPAAECKVCMGTGSILDPSYQEACAVLNKSTPKRPDLLAFRIPRFAIIEESSVEAIEKELRDT